MKGTIQGGRATDRTRAQKIARSVVSLAKFPPQGERGFGSPFTQHAFGVSASDYETQCNEYLLTILQIESREGLDNIDEIAAVEGAGQSTVQRTLPVHN